MESTSRILFFIISSSENVTSSVITGAGLTLCSKSRSTSSALFNGLFAAVTCYYKSQENMESKLSCESWVISTFTSIAILASFYLPIKSQNDNITSPCMVQAFGSRFAFSICPILDRSFSSSFSWVEIVSCFN